MEDQLFSCDFRKLKIRDRVVIDFGVRFNLDTQTTWYGLYFYRRRRRRLVLVGINHYVTSMRN